PPASGPPFDAGSYGTQVAAVRPWCRPSSTAAGLRTGSPAACSTVTVFSLSVRRQRGRPPARRSATSTAPATEGHVLSRQRQDHPVPGPGQPQAEQRRLHLPDQRPVAKFVPPPPPGRGDVRRVPPPPPREVRPFDLGARPPRGPLRPAI